tara:strand:- start:589 stop:771 length:183 start_codon:yes stop_codon:yes gene_type:complete
MIHDEEFDTSPRDYALGLLDSGVVDPAYLLMSALKFMSHDDVREMLDASELSPRFLEVEE